MSRAGAIAAFAACLLAFGAAPARALDLGKPLLLVATPNLQGPYMRTALIAVPVGEQHLGFVLNRASNTTLAALFPQHAPSAKVIDPVYYGGPEMAGAIFAVVRRDPGQALRLFGNLYVTGNAPTINRIIEQAPNDARYFAGFVGWQPGELEQEIERGFWYVTEPDESLFFRPQTDGLWEELIERSKLKTAARAAAALLLSGSPARDRAAVLAARGRYP